jgi:hypothetical protein
MILSDVFDRFAHACPLPVMAQAVLENALNPQLVDQLFEDFAQRQYTRKLLFSTIVDLMSLVVCRIRPAIHAAYQAHAETIDASIKAVYDKLDRTETGLSAALVHATADRLEPVIDALGGARPALLPGYRVKILDGNHLAGTEHRLKELRTMRAGALPGHALVVLDPRLMLVTDVLLCEDGHAQERSLLDQVLPTVRARDLWIEDRNFCTTDFLFGIARRSGFFVVRQHASTLHWSFAGKRRACGRIDTGKVFQQTIRATNDAGEILILRRITVVLDVRFVIRQPVLIDLGKLRGLCDKVRNAQTSPPRPQTTDPSDALTLRGSRSPDRPGAGPPGGLGPRRLHAPSLGLPLPAHLAGRRRGSSHQPPNRRGVPLQPPHRRRVAKPLPPAGPDRPARCAAARSAAAIFPPRNSWRSSPRPAAPPPSTARPPRAGASMTWPPP